MLSLALFIMLMTGCKTNVVIVKQVGEKELLVADAETKKEKIFIFNKKLYEHTGFLQFVYAGDTALIGARNYNKNIEQVFESKSSYIYFNCDSISARYERAQFEAAKQKMTTQKERE